MSRCRDENQHQVTTPPSPLFISASNNMEKAAEQIASDKAELLPSFSLKQPDCTVLNHRKLTLVAAQAREPTNTVS